MLSALTLTMRNECPDKKEQKNNKINPQKIPVQQSFSAYSQKQHAVPQVRERLVNQINQTGPEHNDSTPYKSVLKYK